MKMNRLPSSLAVFCCVVGSVAPSGSSALAASLLLAPSTLSIGVGGTGGFGFSFTNDSSGYAVFNDTALSQQVGGFGDYTDFIGAQNDLVIVAPGATVTQLYSQTKGAGAGSYTFTDSAPADAQIAGTLTFYYDVFSVSPGAANFNSFKDYVGSRQVSQPVTLVLAAIPEPDGLGLAAAGLVLLGIAAKAGLKTRAELQFRP